MLHLLEETACSLHIHAVLPLKFFSGLFIGWLFYKDKFIRKDKYSQMQSIL
jgi:hypothetical protein